MNTLSLQLFYTLVPFAHLDSPALHPTHRTHADIGMPLQYFLYSVLARSAGAPTICLVYGSCKQDNKLDSVLKNCVNYETAIS